MELLKHRRAGDKGHAHTMAAPAPLGAANRTAGSNACRPALQEDWRSIIRTDEEPRLKGER